ncbi:transketolase [Paracoccaceae bacterium]|nr:transketolase [Paracoccaceae bacterium]
MDITTLKSSHPEHWRMATALRVLAMDAVQAANSGHPGMPMGMADAATVLFRNHMKFDAAAPGWADRDRFVLSAGHGSMLLYGFLHLTGYEDFPIEEIKNFRQLGSKTAGHPEFGHGAGIETTTGPLGQGLATAVGMAMAERSMASRFGRTVVDHHTYVIAGDGCLMEGVSHEAIGLAGRLQLGKLIVLWDDNGITIDGQVSLSDLTDQPARFRASGWEVIEVDGHDPQELDKALTAAKQSGFPTLIACKTHIGYGSPSKQDSSKAHGSPLGADEIAATRDVYGWPEGPFEVPADVMEAWRAVGSAGAVTHEAWSVRRGKLTARRGEEFDRVIKGEPPKRLLGAIRKLKRSISDEQPKIATRKASENALAAINPVAPETIGGSADLTGSNNTLTDDLGAFTANNPAGRYVYYGVREHGMAAAMNGMALHGGVTPYGGTFLVFADYAKGAMRLSALMNQRVIYVLTHDSIGLGEDGPTHQPIEQLAMMRATPNMTVFRPADAVETAECWELALTMNGPSALALTRQGLPTIRTHHTNRNQSAQGAYVIEDSVEKRKVILIATGSEVEIALAARAKLEAEGIGARVVSMPSWELFAQQDEAYRRKILPRGNVRIGIEAAGSMGWDRWLSGERGDSRKSAFIGMEGFGASAPAPELYEHFGITAERAVEMAKSLM